MKTEGVNRADFFFEKLTWDQYKKNREEYGFCSSWALWDERILGNKGHCTVEEGYRLGRNDLIIANSETEFFNKGLDVNLNKSIVFLALNSSFNVSETNNNKILKVFKKYNDIQENNHELTASDCTYFNNDLKEVIKNDERYVFSNVWGDAGSGNKSGAGYFRPISENEKAKELLSGAYITDLIKFNKGTCCAIPESDSRGVSSYLRGEKLNEQIQGLKEELDSLEVKHPHFVLLHSRLNSKQVKKRLREVYGEKTFVGQLPHYSPQSMKYHGCRFENYEDMYKYAVDKLVDEINDWSFKYSNYKTE